MTLARLKSVAGVRIPDTALCIAAVDLLESSSPKFLCTHCLRTLHFRQRLQPSEASAVRWLM